MQEREWEQFHTPKNLAMSISIEAAELMELFQWNDPSMSDAIKNQEIAKELADIMIYAIMFCNAMGLDPETVIRGKMEENRSKYPVELSKGSSAKYTDFY